MPPTIIRIAGKAYVYARAVALGLVPGVESKSGEAPSAPAPKPALTRGQKAAATRAANKAAKADPLVEPTESGDRPARRIHVEPLRPRNIDPATGEAVTDEAILAKLAADTAAIEAAAKAAREAEEV